MRLVVFAFVSLMAMSLYLWGTEAEPASAPAVNGDNNVSLSDGAILVDVPESSAKEPLPVAKNVDLKEVIDVPEKALEKEAKQPEQPEQVKAPTEEIDPVAVRKTEDLAKAIVDESKPVVPEESQASLLMLDSEVLPGTSARLAWEPAEAFMGISAPTAVLVVNGKRKGPTLCLTAAVHGDELNGIEIVRHILYNIDPNTLAGAVVGVPIVNLQGFRRSSRYLPDRRDLNRYFPGNPNGSAASRIAFSFFDQVLRHCDMVVDLHTGSFSRTNLPQLRADLAYKKVADLAGKMGSIVVVQSRGRSGSLRRAAVEFGIPSVTLEAGEPHILDKSAVEQGVKSIQTLLHASDMAKTLSFWELRRGPVYYKSRWVRSVNGGILFSSVNLGDMVSQGTVLGTVTDPITNLSTDIVSPHNGKLIGMALNQVLYPGYAAYHIGLQAPASEAAEDETLEAGEQELIDDEDGIPLDEQALPDEANPERDSESIMEVQILEDSE